MSLTEFVIFTLGVGVAFGIIVVVIGALFGAWKGPGSDDGPE